MSRAYQRLSEILYHYVRRTTDKPFIAQAKIDPDSRTFIIAVVVMENDCPRVFAEISAVLRRDPILEAVGRLYAALESAGYTLPEASQPEVAVVTAPAAPEPEDEEPQEEQPEEKPKRRRRVKKKEDD